MIQVIIAALSFLGAVAVAVMWYFRSRGNDEVRLVKSVDALIDSKKKQEQREHNHEKHIEKILGGDLSPSDISRRLSTYPPENSATHAALEKKR